MAHYIDADRLRAEIERRREICADIAADERNEEVADYYRGKEVAHDEIASLITSLQQEHPSLPDELEEAAEEWVRPIMRTPSKAQEYLYTYLLDAFKKGAEWQKAKMMEEAVEGTVVELGETYKDLSLSVSAKELNQVLQPLGLKDGDKVKIIIVKEDK